VDPREIRSSFQLEATNQCKWDYKFFRLS
jgi:hypothetical protein